LHNHLAVPKEFVAVVWSWSTWWGPEFWKCSKAKAHFHIN